MFLLHACMKWFPPIAAQSPSPVKTITFKSGFASFYAGGKCQRSSMGGVECVKIQISRRMGRTPDSGYYADFSLANLRLSIARTTAPVIMPFPHPGHHM